MMVPFKAGNILIPKNVDMTKWSVVACDQYTSEPKYWEEVSEIVGDNPSTLILLYQKFILKIMMLMKELKTLTKTWKKS